MSPKSSSWIIDADSHITEPPDLWTSRVASKWGDLVPHVAWDEENNEQSWFVGDERVFSVGGAAMAGWEQPFPTRPPTYEDAHPASYDANARLKMMDEIGIYAQVLYPNICGFAGQSFLFLKDDELILECVRAYNDFQVDWIQPARERFVPVTVIPFWDIQASVKEVERCARKGHAGILFSGSPQKFGQPYIGDRHWDPLWSIAQEAGLPISFHIGGGDAPESYSPERLEVSGFPAAFALVTIGFLLGNCMQVSDLLLSGVLPRFPGIKFVCVESGIGWIPFLLEALDHEFHYVGLAQSRPEFEMLPSEYFRRHVYACFSYEKVGPERLLDKVGVENVLFETDFPHPGCLYGNVTETIEANLSSQPAEVRHRLLFKNAAELYGIKFTPPKTA